MPFYHYFIMIQIIFLQILANTETNHYNCTANYFSTKHLKNHYEF